MVTPAAGRSRFLALRKPCVRRAGRRLEKHFWTRYSCVFAPNGRNVCAEWNRFRRRGPNAPKAPVIWVKLAASCSQFAVLRHSPWDYQPLKLFLSAKIELFVFGRGVFCCLWSETRLKQMDKCSRKLLAFQKCMSCNFAHFFVLTWPYIITLITEIQ